MMITREESDDDIRQRRACLHVAVEYDARLRTNGMEGGGKGREMQETSAGYYLQGVQDDLFVMHLERVAEEHERHGRDLCA